MQHKSLNFTLNKSESVFVFQKTVVARDSDTDAAWVLNVTETSITLRGCEDFLLHTRDCSEVQTTFISTNHTLTLCTTQPASAWRRRAGDVDGDSPDFWEREKFNKDSLWCKSRSLFFMSLLNLNYWQLNCYSTKQCSFCFDISMNYLLLTLSSTNLSSLFLLLSAGLSGGSLHRWVFRRIHLFTCLCFCTRPVVNDAAHEGRGLKESWRLSDESETLLQIHKWKDSSRWWKQLLVISLWLFYYSTSGSFNDFLMCFSFWQWLKNYCSTWYFPLAQCSVS